MDTERLPQTKSLALVLPLLLPTHPTRLRNHRTPQGCLSPSRLRIRSCRTRRSRPLLLLPRSCLMLSPDFPKTRRCVVSSMLIVPRGS